MITCKVILEIFWCLTAAICTCTAPARVSSLTCVQHIYIGARTVETIDVLSILLLSERHAALRHEMEHSEKTRTAQGRPPEGKCRAMQGKTIVKSYAQMTICVKTYQVPVVGSPWHLHTQTLLALKPQALGAQKGALQDNCSAGLRPKGFQADRKCVQTT